MPRTLTSRSAADVGGRRAFRAALAVLIALLVSSCVESSPAGPSFPLVPDDAVLAVVIDSPYKLYVATDEFWKAAGLTASLGTDLKGIIDKTVPDSAEVEKLLDFARPWALALVPTSPGAQETRTLVYIALRGQSDSLLKKLGGGTMKVVKQAKGYAVFSDKEGAVDFPAAKSLDLSRLAAYPAGSIKLWADPNALRLMTMDAFKPMAKAARSFVSGEGKGSDAAMAALGEAGLGILKELRSADAALVPSAAGLTIRIGAAVRSGGPLEKLLARASAVPSASDWAKQVRSDALYGVAWSKDPRSSSDLSAAILKPLFATMSLPADFVDRLAAVQKRWAAVVGNRGAASFDMDIDPGVFKDAASLQGDEAVAAFKKALSLRLEILQEAKDEGRYRDLVKTIGTDPDIKTLIAAYSDKFGMSFELKNRDKRDGDLAYGDLGVAFKITDPGKLGSLSGKAPETAMAGAQAAMNAIGSMLSMRWTMASGRFVATTGNVADLRALAARSSAEKSLATDAAFIAFGKTIPATPISVGYLSMRRLMEIVTKIAPGSSGWKLDPNRFGSWYSYIAAQAGSGTQAQSSLELGILIPASDIGAFVDLGKSMASARPTAQN